MTYSILIDRYIHPFIIYVLAGTLISYILANVLTRIPILKDSKSRAMFFTIPLTIPFAAYLLFMPYVDYNCIIFKQPIGLISNLLCNGGRILAKILTPLFVVVASFAVFKAGSSLVATRRIKTKYGYSSKEDQPRVFTILEELCNKCSIDLPKIIITKDRFARSFTMGKRSPVIVLSEGLIAALDDEELETVIAHELAHIIRSDSTSKWIMVFLRDLMFFTPVVYWTFRDLAVEKEKASDDFAIRLTNKPMAFANALIKVWRLSPRTLFNSLVFDNFMPHPNFVSHTGVLEQRIKRILNKEHMINHNSKFGLIGVIFLTLLSLSFIYWFC